MILSTADRSLPAIVAPLLHLLDTSHRRQIPLAPSIILAKQSPCSRAQSIAEEIFSEESSSVLGNPTDEIDRLFQSLYHIIDSRLLSAIYTIHTSRSPFLCHVQSVRIRFVLISIPPVQVTCAFLKQQPETFCPTVRFTNL